MIEPGSSRLETRENKIIGKLAVLVSQIFADEHFSIYSQKNKGFGVRQQQSESGYLLDELIVKGRAVWRQVPTNFPSWNHLIHSSNPVLVREKLK